MLYIRFFYRESFIENRSYLLKKEALIMIKIPKFDIKDLKKMGENLVGSVTSGGILGKKTDKSALPEEIKKNMEALEQGLSQFLETQKTMNEVAENLKKTAANLGQATLALYKPEGKDTAKPTPTETSTPKTEAKTETIEEKPAEEAKKEEEPPTEEAPSEEQNKGKSE